MKKTYSEEEKRHYKHLSIGIFAMSFAMSLLNGIMLWCLMHLFS